MLITVALNYKFNVLALFLMLLVRNDDWFIVPGHAIITTLKNDVHPCCPNGSLWQRSESALLPPLLVGSQF